MIICISGLPGSGKTTVAKQLIESFTKQGRQIFHVNSDLVANKILIKKYGFNADRDIDYETEELNIIYSSMYSIIQNVLTYNKNVIVITDGMYRKNSQRILLEIVAQQTHVPFHFIKLDTSEKESKKRLERRFQLEGLGGWVDAREYEEVLSGDVIFISNNSNQIQLREKVERFVNRLVKETSLINSI